ncbi:MAG: protease modulator HflC [Lachnospiraceae bacterium]|nr:protease modulator HflC [Lachnospiraceae bacterium]
MGNKQKKTVIVLCVLVVAVILFQMVTYTTQENEYTVVKQFGKISSINASAGLRVKIPFIQTVNSIPKSMQFYDLPKSDVITSDKKSMIADAYVLWKITDPKLFTSSLNANTSTAEGRIDVIVYNAIKTTISNMTQEEVIVSRDDKIEISEPDDKLDGVEIKDITTENGEVVENDKKEEKEPKVIAISSRLLKCVGSQCEQYGIEITNIEIKVLDLPNENKDAVYERMITERNNIAAAYKAQGKSEAQIIKNTTDKEVAVMKSEAQATADKTEAEGEAEYMKILSKAYNNKNKADFYLFSKSLDTAKESLKGGKTTLFLDKNSPIAQIFQGAE